MNRDQDDRMQEVLRRVGIRLNVPFDRSELDIADASASAPDGDVVGALVIGAAQIGVLLREAKISSEEIPALVTEGLPVVVAKPDGVFWVLERLIGNRIEATSIADTIATSLLRSYQLPELTNSARLFVGKKELECDLLSSATAHGEASHGHGSHGHGMKPMRRFLALLRLDQRDVLTICLFALVSGVLGLATPLAIESLVNVVSWGTYLQPLLVLALMLFACLGLAGILNILQSVIVELIQRRLLVRIVGDLAHRFPRANRNSLVGVFPRELANRVFDIMTIQKASAVLLLDGISIGLTAFLGLMLLAFYHPYLLGFDLVLMLCMVFITLLLGRGGVRTAIEESIVKYKIAAWLQDVLATPAPFKVNGGEHLAVERANRLTTEYLNARQHQFRVVIRQFSFAVTIQVIASTSLLGLGGWLVIQQQLTLGQLVASELVVTIVVGAFAKAGKSLEKFYDLMAGIDKVGHLLDIPVDPRYEMVEASAGPVDVRWEDLSFHDDATGQDLHLSSVKLAAGSRAALVGDQSKGSLLVKCMAGLVEPAHGIVEVGGHEARRAALSSNGSIIGYAGKTQVFSGSLQENIDLGRPEVSQNRVREVLVQVGLWDTVLGLRNGLKTSLISGGAPMSESQVAQLAIAQAMAGRPKLLLLDLVLDQLSPAELSHIWPALSAPDATWTLLLVTNRASIAELCTTQIHLETD